MRKRTIVVAVWALTSLACGEQKETKEDQELTFQHETPDVLEEDKRVSIGSSYGSRGDIIERLFREAADKDPKLSVLLRQMEELELMRQDSLAAYNKYLRINEEYWTAAEGYINEVSDSTLKIGIRAAFNIWKDKYRERIAEHTAAMDQLEARIQALYDQQTMLKLVVTERMMNNYQRNELIDLKTIADFHNRYDQLIKRTSLRARIGD